MSLDHLSDEELISKVCHDHWEAFAELYERYKARVYTFYKKRTSAEMAEDLLQKCFMRIHEKAHTFDSQFLAASWIFTLARNLMYDEFRQIERDGRLGKKYSDEFEVISNTDVWDSVKEDVESLDEKQRNLIYWRYREGREFSEIAQMLDTSKENARQLVSRAVKSLRSIIEKESSL